MHLGDLHNILMSSPCPGSECPHAGLHFCGIAVQLTAHNSSPRAIRTAHLQLFGMRGFGNTGACTMCLALGTCGPGA
jgi:hypothetical protein